MPSSRVRVLNLLPELRKRGINCDVLPYPKGFTGKIRMFRILSRYEAIFLQKKLPTPLESIILKKLSPLLIFDFDDAIYLKHDSSENLVSRSRMSKFKAIARKSDLIIAGNRILAEEAKRFNKNVVVIPSAVEIRDIPQKDYKSENERVIIGWVGGAINLIHLKLVEPVLKKLSEEYSIELRIICSESLYMEGVKIKFIPWRLDTQEAEIAKFDIGIMPLPKTRHSEGKCGYKALQYMAAAVPPVVSDVGINSEIVEHGSEGFVAKDLDDFYKYLRLLIENKELRKKMGLSARQKVEKHYSIAVVSEILSDVLLSSIKLR
ncbi:MAG: glycosyltransferase family 4 protein [Thermodesulfovibrionales bacterium]|nr:glycosyltransferase family 4 protein [Thermodesulfovibrionales bacterium]